MVYVVLRDIKKVLQDESLTNEWSVDADIALLNDTLLGLLELEVDTKNISSDKAIRHFNLLKHFGLHLSAYNLLYERYDYQNLEWDRDSLCSTLLTSANCESPWIEDDTK